MALISETKKGNENGGFTRTLGCQKFGAVLSQIHATSIRNGNELETIIIKNISTDKILNDECINKYKENPFLVINEINKNTIITKEYIKIIKKHLNINKEPDLIYIDFDNKVIYIIEIKEGISFDTKKSDGELNSLTKFSTIFKEKIDNYDIQFLFCSFSANNKNEIIKGTKGRFSEYNVCTGEELCMLLNININNIHKEKKHHQKENLNLFFDNFLEIVSNKKYFNFFIKKIVKKFGKEKLIEEINKIKD